MIFVFIDFPFYSKKINVQMGSDGYEKSSFGPLSEIPIVNFLQYRRKYYFMLVGTHDAIGPKLGF
jgi:hypothetical protein